MKRFMICTVVSLILATATQAQSAQQELLATRNAYRNYENLSMEVTVYNYAEKTSAAALVGKGKMSKSKKGYYSRFMNDELISNSSCTVIINHETKTINCFPGDPKGKRQPDFVSVIDSAGNPGDSLVYKGVVSGEKLIVIYHRNSYLSKTEVYLTPSTSLISRIIYFYAPASEEESADAYKTEIIYDRLSFEVPDENLFSEKNFVDYKNKQWLAAAAYKNYHLTVIDKPNHE